MSLSLYEYEHIPRTFYLHNKIGNIYEQPNPWDILFVGNILWIKFSIGLTFSRSTYALPYFLIMSNDYDYYARAGLHRVGVIRKVATLLKITIWCVPE